MTLLLSKQIDVAEAMIYNEYAQVLEAKNPETGELYQPTDLNVINYNDVGHGDAPGRAVRARFVAGRGRQRGHRDALPQGLVPGLDLLPDQSGRLHPVHGQRGLDAGRRAPGLDDERDQPAGLAVAERHRDHGSRRMAADRRCRARQPASSRPRRRPRRSAPTSPTAALAGITDDAKGADFQKGEVQVTEGGN